MTRDYDELFRVPVNRARRPVSESRTSTCDLPWAPESPALPCCTIRPRCPDAVLTV